MDKKLKKSIGLVLLAFLSAIFFVKQNTVGTSWSLLPPALAIFVAFTSGKLALSLGSAVFIGSFLSVYGKTQDIFLGISGGVVKNLGFFAQAVQDKTHLQILGFVFFILSMVHMMTASGGLHALVRSLSRWVVGPKSAQFMTVVMGCFIFIDDYANTMIVGSTMRKITDKYNISREKLAFLVDATSAPIAGVALVSTWIGYEVGLFSEMAQKFSWGIDGYTVFLDAIGFRFYCFFMLIFVFANVISGVDFGSMKNARLNRMNHKEDDNISGHLICSVLPLVTLLLAVFSLLWADGGGLEEGRHFWSLSDWRSVLMKSENGVFILLVSAASTYVLSVLLALFVSKMSFVKIKDAFLEGVKSSWLPTLILILAWSVKAVCDDLDTGEFIVSLLGNQLNVVWLPFGIFVISAITAFATGTSWGTMAILIPTMTPLAVSLGGGGYGVYVALCLAAILDGAIMGDHCSPVSDTTIMSSISTGCDHLQHVKTQLPYSLLVGAMALCFGYLPVGLGMSKGLSFLLALVFIPVLFFVLKKWQKSSKAAI